MRKRSASESPPPSYRLGCPAEGCAEARLRARTSLKTGCIFTYTKNIKTGESKCKETHTLFNTLYQYGITTELMNTITSDFTLRSGTYVTPSDLTLIVRDEKCCIAYSSPHSATTAPLYSYLVPNLPVSIYGTSS